jgi:hypothetical protein
LTARQARIRLGLDEHASRDEVLQAHHRLVLLAARLPPETISEIVQAIDEARDVLLGPERTRGTLDVLASPRGMAALSVGSLLLAGLSLLPDASVGVLGVLAPGLLLVGLTLSVRRRKLLSSVLLAVALAASGGLAVRRVADPGTHTFYYNGDLMSSDSRGSPFAHEPFIPLTLDPSHGHVEETVAESAEFVVSCTKAGTFKDSRSDVLWAYIADGDYQSFWLPVPYLGGLQPGAARTLLSCSNWRWWLRKFGSP